MAQKYNKKFLFRVEVEGIKRAAFMNCSAAGVEITSSEVWEGGALFAHKEPARVKFTDFTLERGVTVDRDMYDLLTNLIEAAFGVKGAGTVGRGSSEDGVEFIMDIVRLNRAQKESGRLRVHVAHVTKYETSGWDNNSDDAETEKLSVAVSYWHLV